MSSNVYFTKTISSASAAKLLQKLSNSENISWNQDLPIKIHPGAIGNNAFTKPGFYSDTISYLKSQNVKPYFIETCMNGEKSYGKEKEFIDHGFTEIPFVIADGKNGDEHIEVPISGKHFTKCLIAKKLAHSNQVLVVSHFKGHCMSGFGAAIKMLGIGFASGRGKTVVHSKFPILEPGQEVDWDHSKKSTNRDEYNLIDWNPEVVSCGIKFSERVAEYATAAAKDKNFVYLTFAMNFAPDCDCDGKEMKFIYPDLGIFASTDPVAIDKAIFDMLEIREGKVPFAGSEIFQYAQSLGLGSTEYTISEI